MNNIMRVDTHSNALIGTARQVVVGLNRVFGRIVGSGLALVVVREGVPEISPHLTYYRASLKRVPATSHFNTIYEEHTLHLPPITAPVTPPCALLDYRLTAPLASRNTISGQCIEMIVTKVNELHLQRVLAIKALTRKQVRAHSLTHNSVDLFEAYKRPNKLAQLTAATNSSN